MVVRHGLGVCGILPGFRLQGLGAPAVFGFRV